VDRIDPIEHLPFVVRWARTPEDLRKAVAIRQRAFARHVPALGQQLAQPEPADSAPDSCVLLATAKADGSPLGSARLRTNDRRPLTMEQSVELPAYLRNSRLLETVRLSVAAGPDGAQVKHALLKAVWFFCLENAVDYAMVAARRHVDRQYTRMLFTDVFADGAFIPMKHSSGIPHRVLQFEVATAARRFLEAKHDMARFYLQTQHPDIQVTGPSA
jgi:hypothetical protein